MAKGSVDSSNPNAPALSISTTGAFNNFGNNGQAFNAVRNVSAPTSTNTTRAPASRSMLPPSA